MQGIKGRAFKIRLCGVPRGPYPLHCRSAPTPTGAPPIRARLLYKEEYATEKNATFHKRPVQAASKIFFNAQKYDIMPSEEEKDFFKFLSGGSADSEFTKDLDLLVTSARHNAQWRQQFMTWEQEVQLSYNRGLEEGQKIGQKEALKKYAISMLKDAILPLEKISEYTQLPVEELEALQGNAEKASPA